MQVKDLQPRLGKVDIVLKIDSVDEPREFSKFGKTGRVANAKGTDETGTVKVTLWNEQVDQVKPGAKIHITNGYVSEWQGEMQLSTGRFGKLEVLEQGEAPAPASTEEPKPKMPGEEPDLQVAEEEIADLDEDVY